MRDRGARPDAALVRGRATGRDLMRLFVALVPPAAVVAALPQVPVDVRAVPRDQVHLTVAFLGEQPSPEPIVAALDEVVTGAAPVLQLAGAGAFGNAVWLGLRGDLGRLAELAADVQNAVRTTGLELEPRHWRPHVTIGRSRHRRNVRPGEQQTLGQLSDYLGPRAAWDEVRLVRSHLGRDGARHETIVRWHLDVASAPSP